MPSTNSRVLVIDDEKRVCALLCAMLGERGYEVASASTISEALAQVESFHPDVILMDIMMSGLSGLDLLQVVRDRPFPPRVIMVTATSDEQSVQQAMQRGAEAFVCKPVNFDTLERLISRVWPSQPTTPTST